MASEPLKINDERFLINRLIDQAPKSTLVREFFKNAEESAATATEGDRKVKIYPVVIDGVKKLAFWNTGIGMDDEELRRATDLSSSINKEMSLEGNFGIGAKVSGLTMSKHGIRYRSCKSGVVNEVTIGFDDNEGTYVRYDFELQDGSSETVLDVTEQVTAEGVDVTFDWTEVVLFGESPEHDTVVYPLGLGVKVDRSYITSNIFRRFASFKEGLDVRIDVAMTKGGGKDETGKTRQLKTLESVLEKLPRHERIKEGDVCVHYIHDPKHKNYSHSLSALANPATASTTFCAIVHKGERYDLKTGKGWSAVAPIFGVPFGSKVITVEIEIDDELALPNQYRDGLTWPNDRSPMEANDFAFYVRELMPDWVKDIVKSESPKSDDKLDDIQADLQKLLDEFRVPTPTLRPSHHKSAVASSNSEEGFDTTECTNVDNDFEKLELHEEISDHPADSSERNQRAQKDKARKAPDGARASRSSLALERVPEIEILIEPEDIAEKELKGRAGRYYKESQTLFINGLYSVIDRMAGELEPELRNLAEPEFVREVILKVARRSLAYRVGKAACFAISKRRAEDWTSDDLDRATTPESLSIAADDFKQSINQARKLAKELIKSEKFKNEDAA
ncbi:hypothetical protein GCM10007939_22740 [Amylibacter marinus]|uniref:Histidine kinase-, DNA gyrase B-, and HSP90-like ATPase n=1 Tax=Amylibacter marinus TaxID=1475483 RepID=A0ABQ5VX37_9RHOB|nr:ATP-binding protein [Amylibacter marinus]GLQ35990.1 hypothetical protein GCM10007939_22740 [Amylibacter marinus]